MCKSKLNTVERWDPTGKNRYVKKLLELRLAFGRDIGVSEIQFNVLMTF